MLRNYKIINLTEENLSLAIEIVDFLKENTEEPLMFQEWGNAQVRRQIFKCITDDNFEQLKSFMTPRTVLECATALQMFLNYLKEPLIPERVQQLVLAENPGIPERIIAADAVGLLYQELNGKHLQLLTSLLVLLNSLNKRVIRNELSSLQLPFSLLSTFFNISNTMELDGINLRRAAYIFYELIILASEILEKQQPKNWQLVSRLAVRPRGIFAEGRLPLHNMESQMESSDYSEPLTQIT